MSRNPGRLRRLVRAHPVRSVVAAGVAALLLIGAALVSLPGDVIESGTAPGEGRVQGGLPGDRPPVSRDLPEAGADPAETDGAGSSGAGGGLGRGSEGTESSGAGGGSAAAGGPAGAGGSSADSGGGAQPGASPDGTTGDLLPVEPRTPVRCAPTGAPTAGALPSADERDGRRWVTVGRLAGRCDASSSAFPLQGIETRLVWRSDADSFAVFVVDVVQGREASAGFADGQCAGTCSESQSIVPAAGSYRLEVQAGDAPWEVEIQEYRRP